MAIYHLNMKTISRSQGGTAANALAYESGVCLASPVAEVDFSKKSTLGETQIIGSKDDLQGLADKMELAENRKNSTVGRRMTIALPHELPLEKQREAVKEFAEFLNAEFGVAVVANVHAPDRGGDTKNVHAHLTFTDRKIGEDGELGAKCRELTCMNKKLGIDGVPRAKHNLQKMREKWQDIANNALEQEGHSARIDHRSLKAQGINRTPGQHQGKVKTEIQRKGKAYKISSVELNREIKEKYGIERDTEKAAKRTTQAREAHSGGVDAPERGARNGHESQETEREGRPESGGMERNAGGSPEAGRRRFDQLIREVGERNARHTKRRKTLERWGEDRGAESIGKPLPHHLERLIPEDTMARYRKIVKEALSQTKEKASTMAQQFRDAILAKGKQGRSTDKPQRDGYER